MRVLYILSLIYIPTSLAETLHDSDSIYFDLKSGLPLPIESVIEFIENGTTISMPLNDNHNEPTIADTKLKNYSRIKKINYRSNGCGCQELTCGCCTGINMQQFNFNREGCMNLTYDPLEFSITLDMFMNENHLFSNRVSAKNPPPFCMPVVVPYLPFVDFCARLFNIHTPGQNLHMCLDFETRIQRATVLVLHFDCMRMGGNGIALLKPGDPTFPISSTTSGPPATDEDIYDEVTEIKYKN